MNLADVSIRRPVFITMIIMAVVILGLTAIQKLPVELFPEADIPYVMVVTIYPGASPEEVDLQVTDKLEDELSSLSDLKKYYSTSGESMSNIMMEFHMGVDLDAKVNEIRDKIDLVINDLPDDAEDPFIQQIDPTAFPILFAAVSAPRSELEVRKAVDDIVSKQLEKINGVANVGVSGGQEREIQVNVNRDKLIGYNLSILQVVQALGRDNIDFPAGKIKKGTDESIVRLMGEYRTVDEIKDVEIAGPMGLVKIGDIATVVDSVKDTTKYSRLNSENAVTMEIIKQSGANTVEVAADTKKALKTLVGKYLPDDYIVRVTMDMSHFVVNALAEVKTSLLYGGLFATLMIFLFLKDLRSTFIIFLALPTAIIGTFMPIYVAGFTINFMSLMGLSIAVGTLVDNSVVVLENIYRHLEMGKPPAQAAADGVKQVGLAVIASGSTNICVFIPVAFMTGMTGQFFKQFGFSVVFATIFAIFIAFTLTPALSARMFKQLKDENGEKIKTGQSFIMKMLGVIFFPFTAVFRYLLFPVFDFFMGRVQRSYPAILRANIKLWPVTIIVITGIFLATLKFVFPLVKQEYVPSTDQGEIYVLLDMPAYSSLDDTNNAIKDMEEFVKTIPEVETYTGIAGQDLKGSMSQKAPTKGYMTINLVGFADRDRSTDDIISLLRHHAATIPDATFQIVQANMGGPPGQLPLEVDIMGPDMETLVALSEKIENIVKATPGAQDVNSSYETGKSEIRVIPDKEKMARMGLDVATVGMTMRASLEGDDSVKYRVGGDEYDIRVRFDGENRQTVEDVKNIPIMTKRGAVRLSNVARVEQDLGYATLRRKDGVPLIKLEGALGDKTINEVVNSIKAGIKKMGLPKGYTVEYEGEYSQMSEMGAEMGTAMLLALIFIYMVMAAQFESFLQPLVVMFTLPLTFIGVVWSLYLSNNTFNMMSQIGIVLLIGIVVNNGILLIDFINQKREEGMSRNDAILDASPKRLRPILITTLSTICGMVPAAFFGGEGGGMRAPMAIIAIGGLTVSAVLTLVFIPAMYILFDSGTRAVLYITGKRDLPPLWDHLKKNDAAD